MTPPNDTPPNSIKPVTKSAVPPKRRLKLSPQMAAYLIYFATGATAAHLAQLAIPEKPPSIPVSFLFGAAITGAACVRDMQNSQMPDSTVSPTQIVSRVTSAVDSGCDRLEVSLTYGAEQIAENAKQQAALLHKMESLTGKVDTLTFEIQQASALALNEAPETQQLPETPRPITQPPPSEPVSKQQGLGDAFAPTL